MHSLPHRHSRTRSDILRLLSSIRPLHTPITCTLTAVCISVNHSIHIAKKTSVPISVPAFINVQTTFKQRISFSNSANRNLSVSYVLQKRNRGKVPHLRRRTQKTIQQFKALHSTVAVLHFSPIPFMKWGDLLPATGTARILAWETRKVFHATSTTPLVYTQLVRQLPKTSIMCYFLLFSSFRWVPPTPRT